MCDSLDFEEKLCQLVGANPVLYDPKHLIYNNIKKRQQAWVGIGKKLGKKPEYCKKKWSAMRNNYRKVLLKIRGLGGLQNYHRRWRFLDHMKFMHKHEALGYLLEVEDEPPSRVTKHQNLSSPKFVFRFLELVRSHKVLYDPSAPGYADVDERNYAWHLIGKELNVNKNDLKKKWHSIRSAYANLLKRIADKGGLDKYNRKWMYFYETSFLTPFITNLSEDFIKSTILAQTSMAVKAESTNKNGSISSQDFSNYDDEGEDENDEEADEDDENDEEAEEDDENDEEAEEDDDAIDEVKVDKYASQISSTVGDIEHLSDTNSEHDEKDEDENYTNFGDTDEDEIETDDYLPSQKIQCKKNAKNTKLKYTEILSDVSDDRGPCNTYLSLLGSKIDESAIPLGVRYKLEKCVTDIVYTTLQKYPIN